MKTPFKLGNQRRPLAITGGLALAISLLGVLPATAQEVSKPIPATTTMPATTPATATTKTTTADPKNAANTANAANQDTSLSEYNNWVTLGIGGTFVDGDKAQFQHLK